MKNTFKFNFPSTTEQGELEMIGLTIWVTEGCKSRKNVYITNSNIRIIKLFKRFLLEICGIPKEKLKCRIQLHDGNCSETSLNYWMKELNLEKNNIFITRKSVINSSNNKHPMGICSLRFNSVDLVELLKGRLEQVFYSKV